MSRKINKPNFLNNSFSAIEKLFIELQEQIDNMVAGTTSFENIQGNPEDNTALAQVLNEKADDDDIANLQSQINDKVDKVNGKELMPSNLPTQVQQNTDAIGNINTALGNKVDKVNGYGLMPNNLPDRVTQNETDIQDLKDDKQDKMQFEVMPDAEEYLGKIVQYVGPTDLQYTNGIFYQADYDSALLEYKWIPKSSGGGSGEYIAGQGIEITGNIIKCTIISDTITSTTTTWSSQKLRQEFENLAGATRVIVAATRPQVGELNTIYYIGTEAPYEIWLYTSANTWVYLGETGINLEDYYTKTEVDNLINDVKPVSGGDATTIGIIPNHGGRTVSVNVDNDSIKINGSNKLYAPLKTINNESISGTGNIAIGSAAQPRELTITQLNANIESVTYTYNTIEYPTFYINLLTLTFNGMNFAANTNIQVCNLRGIVGSAYGPDVWLGPIKVANRGYLGTANQIVSASGVNVFLLCNNALSNDAARINVSFITLKS